MTRLGCLAVGIFPYHGLRSPLRAGYATALFRIAMNVNTADHNEVINQMVALRLQRAELDDQIAALQPVFIEACAALDISQLEHEQALIFRKLTRGQWDYPDHIQEQEQQLKQIKQQFRDTHEPTTGRELSWVIRLSN